MGTMKRVVAASWRMKSLVRPSGVWMAVAIALLGWLSAPASQASAHGGAVHSPSTLPACTARMLTCELLSDPGGPVPTPTPGAPDTRAAPSGVRKPLEHRHCLDGMGAPRDCRDIAPFAFLPLDPRADKAVAAVQNLTALGPTPCSNGEADAYPCRNVDLLSFLPITAIGGGSGSDLWGWTDPDSGKEYAIVGRTSGTSFVDLSDPTAPIYLGNLPTHTGGSVWRDVKVYRNHAFIVSDLNRDHGLQVFDLTQLRTITAPPVTLTETAYYDEFGDAHNIVINEESGYAYAVGSDTCSGGLHMIDIRTPAAPAFAGCFAADGYVHDAQCVRYRGPDPRYHGSEICFGSNEDTLTIIDVTDKAAPSMVARVDYPGAYYVHQAWLTENQRYLLQDDELDELFGQHNSRTYMWDVSTLGAPRLIGQYTGELAATDHNLYVRGSYAFQANYASGLRILDLTDIANANLREVAYFDTHPASDSNRMTSAWSVYPYFASGAVAVSTMGEGLFVLQPRLPAEFTLTSSDTVRSLCAEQGGDTQQTLTLQASAYNGYTGSVNMALSGAPAGVTATLATDAVTFHADAPADTATANAARTVSLTLTIHTVTEGIYPIRVRADDGETQHEETVMLYLARSTPGAVTMGYTAATSSFGADLSWQTLPTAATYTVEVATDRTFDTTVDTGYSYTGAYSIRTSLRPNTTYFWRVRANNACGAGELSPVQTLTTKPAFYMPVIFR